MGGHLSFDKLFSKIVKRFFWINMRDDVTKYCNSCLKCQEVNKIPKYNKAELASIPSSYPFQRLAMDCLGPLNRTRRGNSYIVVISDYFTKWTEAFATSNIEAGTVSRLLVDHYICRFGVPERIHTDQGSNFESRLFQNICQTLGISKTRTTPYYPQSDGMVERFNRTIVSMLSKCLEEEEDWDTILQKLMMCYRSSPHKTTGVSPYFAVFGREPSLPIDVIIKNDSENWENMDDYLEDIFQKQKKILKQIRDNSDKKFIEMKQYYNKSSHGSPYKPGDKVMYKNPHANSKFSKV
uniref:Retrovirus-related Pol polyprotein from transposon 412 (Trinotate prediction) n=1 Tax=Henneguya salminicola TaxID=69463 RepID=A0A6G3MFZ0_HENSL